MKTIVRAMCGVMGMCLASVTWAADGVVMVKSQHSVSGTVERFTTILTEKSFTIFNTIDHAKGAASVGNELPPTQVVIFL